MDEAVYVDVAPTIEVRGGVFYVVLASGARFAAPPHVFLKALGRAAKAAEAWGRQNASVGEFIAGKPLGKH